MLEIYSSTVNKELQGIHTGIFNPLRDKSGLGVYDLFIHFHSFYFTEHKLHKNKHLFPAT